MNDHRDQIRIVQETVSGKEITFAHVIGGPSPIIYQKLGLNPSAHRHHHQDPVAGGGPRQTGPGAEGMGCY